MNEILMKKSKEKVSDEELLAAIWLLQVRNTARGCIDNYIGNRKGITSQSMQHYAQDIHLMTREKLGVPLSNGHLRKRLIKLIEGGMMKWSVRNCSFWIDNDKAKEVFDYACKWWDDRGVPSGYDQERKAMRCEIIEGFDDLAEKLEKDLVERFGNQLLPEQK